MRLDFLRPLPTLIVLSWWFMPGWILPISATMAAESGGEDKDPVVKLVLHPMAEARPALRYQLLPGIIDRRPGNAAVDYGKVMSENTALFGDRELWDKIDHWTSAPLEELRRDEVHNKVGFRSAYDLLQRGARREHCDWQLPIREQEFLSMLIPEAHQARTFARLIAARARAQIAVGRFDEAIATLQTGYALGRHVGDGPTLIHGLIGFAICRMMSQQVQQLVQQPQAPNLYWALTRLPRPLIDVHEGIEAEMSFLWLSFPELRDPDDTSRGADHWRWTLNEFWRKFIRCTNAPQMAKRPEVLTLLALKGYPQARRCLIAEGLEPEQVDALPAPQVILMYTVRTYDELRDDVFKWSYVPYWKAAAGVEAAKRRLRQSALRRREILPVAEVLLPAVSSFNVSLARHRRGIALLRTVEALRMYAAGHDGQLPGRLGEVGEVPVPEDPVTGKPFVYTRRGDAAVLDGPRLPAGWLPVEIKLAR